MKRTAISVLTMLALASVSVRAQTQPKSFVGTVAGFKAEAAEIEIKPDDAAPVAAKITPDTVAQKIAPGEKDLKKAEAIKVTEVAKGDRVLVTLEAGTTNLRRIVVMTATDIAKRNAADRADWAKRGVAGIVSAKKGDEITVKVRSLQSVVDATVTVKETTSFKRYAPDSVKFSEARSSKLAEVGVGDQLRARGQKSEDGRTVAAEEVVFGTFLTKAGAITAVNAEAKEITVKDLITNKPLAIKFTADSVIKRMPDLAAMMGAAGRMGVTPGGASAAGGRAPATPAGSAAAAAGRGPGSPGGRGLGAMDIAQMLEMMPAAKIEDLKPGETIVVSSTKGARNDQVTAIMFLTNADLLIQIASAAGRGSISQVDLAAAMAGASGAGGLGVGGIVP